MKRLTLVVLVALVCLPGFAAEHAKNDPYNQFADPAVKLDAVGQLMMEYQGKCIEKSVPAAPDECRALWYEKIQAVISPYGPFHD